jgi:uncharacterized peroxidase-related enzyme
MLNYPLHTKDTAPKATHPHFDASLKEFGMIPNLYGVMANAPPVLDAYRSLGALFMGGPTMSLDPIEQQVVLLATSYENQCSYCMGAHSAIAGMMHIDQDIIDALRDGTPIKDPKLEALRQLAAAITRTRGWPDEAIVSNFLNVGYTQEQVLEVILGVTMKTLSNYVNHTAGTPLDEAFKPAAWTPPNKEVA